MVSMMSFGMFSVHWAQAAAPGGFICYYYGCYFCNYHYMYYYYFLNCLHVFVN